MCNSLIISLYKAVWHRQFLWIYLALTHCWLRSAWESHHYECLAPSLQLIVARGSVIWSDLRVPNLEETPAPLPLACTHTHTHTHTHTTQRCLCVYTCKEYTNLLWVWVWLKVGVWERERERKEVLRYTSSTERLDDPTLWVTQSIYHSSVTMYSTITHTSFSYLW